MTFRSSRRTHRTWLALAGAAALLAVGIAACGSSPGLGNVDAGPSSSASAAAPSVPGGTVRMALPSGARLSYIWPYMPLTSASRYDAQSLQLLMYRPLYLFGDDDSSVAVNYPLSVADAPRYSADGKTVTITMKGWKWSDGETVGASDVIFWLNMMRAEPASFYGYVPGLLPDNLASYRATGPDTVVLHLKSAVSSIWFTYNQLAEITPMPAGWDISSAGAKPGSGGCATDNARDQWDRCVAVYNYLSGQAKDAKDYATNPLWGIVDGPWKLTASHSAPGPSGANHGPASALVTSFAPNKAYSGSPKPRIDELTYYAYAGDAAEYTALRTGRLDLGYVPREHLPPLTSGQVLPTRNPLGTAFTLSAADNFSVPYLAINFNNPALGPAFRQLYVRQAMQELVDQEGMVNEVQHGYGYPTSGGVPGMPQSQWVPAIQHANGGQGPYPFSVASATSLLTSHGWEIVRGLMTCVSAGTGRNQCGAGVEAGTRLSMTMDYPAGQADLQQETAILRSDMARAGIRLTVVPRSRQAVTGEAKPCQPSDSACRWQVASYGGWTFNGPGFEPSGDPLFATGAAANVGNFSDPMEDKLIGLTHTSDSLSVFQDYARYTAEQLPVIWLPDSYSVVATSARLANAASNPLPTLLPEYWYVSR